jgi:hypothetical protein
MFRSEEQLRHIEDLKKSHEHLAKAREGWRKSEDTLLSSERACNELRHRNGQLEGTILNLTEALHNLSAAYAKAVGGE